MSTAMDMHRPPAWIAATDIGSALPACLDAMGRDLDTQDRRIQAALFVWGYAWRVAAPAIACQVARRPVPDVAAESVALRIDENGAVGAVAFRSPRFAEAAPGWLHARLEAHFSRLVAAVQTHSALGVRAQWALTADSCATAFLDAGERLGREQESSDEAAAFLATAGSPLRSRATFFSLEAAGRRSLFLRRRSCCLAHRIRGQEHCSTCPLLPEDERVQRLRADMAVRA